MGESSSERRERKLKIEYDRLHGEPKRHICELYDSSTTRREHIKNKGKVKFYDSYFYILLNHLYPFCIALSRQTFEKNNLPLHCSSAALFSKTCRLGA